jgi:hypothetical protein
MKEIFYTSKEINPNHYFEIGIDDGYPVLYVYKNGELFDHHFSVGSSFEAEMKNTIDCFITVHGTEPSIEDILHWRGWFKMLKANKVIF